MHILHRSTFVNERLIDVLFVSAMNRPCNHQYHLKSMEAIDDLKMIRRQAQSYQRSTAKIQNVTWRCKRRTLDLVLGTNGYTIEALRNSPSNIERNFP